MSGLKKAAIVFVVILAAAQLVRPDRTNPPIDASLAIQAQTGASNDLGALLDRSCGDCHTNGTVWRWYTQIAPVSWLMAAGVKEGRKAINFSEWGTYPPARQQALLALSCADVTSGKMPGPYTLVRPETALSDVDVEKICAASRARLPTSDSR